VVSAIQTTSVVEAWLEGPI